MTKLTLLAVATSVKAAISCQNHRMLAPSGHCLDSDLLRLLYTLFFLLESGKGVVSLTGAHDFDVMRPVQILVFYQAAFTGYITAKAVQLIVLSQSQCVETATGNSNYSMLL